MDTLHLLVLCCGVLLTPAMIRCRVDPSLTGRSGEALALRDQGINLSQLRGDLRRLEPPRRQICS
jgi:hypothetical protein